MTVFSPSFPPVNSMTTKMGESGLGSATAATRCHKCGNGNPRDITDVLAVRVKKSRRVCITIHLMAMIGSGHKLGLRRKAAKEKSLSTPALPAGITTAGPSAHNRDS